MVGLWQSQEMTNRWFRCEGQAGRAGRARGDSSVEFCLERRLNISHVSICTRSNVSVEKGQRGSPRIIKIIISTQAFQTGFREAKSARAQLSLESTATASPSPVWGSVGLTQTEIFKIGAKSDCWNLQVPEKQIESCCK